MTKFLVLYRSSTSSAEQMMSMTPEQGKAEMDAWMSWAARVHGSITDLGAPLGASTVLRGSAGTGFIGGYTIVQAESLDAAKALFDGHPHYGAPGAAIELLEVLEMPGH